MLLYLLACKQEQLTIFVVPEQEEVIMDFVEKIDDSRLLVSVSPDPARDIQAGRGLAVALVLDSQEDDRYKIEQIASREYTIHGDILGLQYGMSDVLEHLDYRFYHPYASYIPTEWNPDWKEGLLENEVDNWQIPDMKTRGLHLHTLHPIEGFYDFWTPSADNLANAERVIDWMIKNRGNYIEWVALDNIVDNPIASEPWREHTQHIVDFAHQRGVTTGIGVQLFGSGNLQNAYDLVDNIHGDTQQQIRDRLSFLLEDTKFDVLELSFGEFFDEDPDVFIDYINTTYDISQQVQPNIEVTSRIHVGDDLQITYNGQEMIYYFLAAFANTKITPWVHTVMYYNLFDLVNGAYHHEDFTEHREFLFQRLQNGLPVVYFPESAYWVAFDNSVPVYLPLYIHSRWLDMYNVQSKSAERGHNSLQDHVLFSSGWEWGYWQNDVTTLKMNWKVPESYLSVLEQLFSNYSNGKQVSQTIFAVAELQKEYLITQQLDAYYACVDNIMELGYTQGIISQPKRPSFEEMLTMDADTLENKVVVPFSEYSTQLQSYSFDALDVWQEEIQDGLSMDLYRAQFMQSLVQSVVAKIRGEDTTSYFDFAQHIVEQAQSVVNNRKDNAWDPREKLYSTDLNSTRYQYGYLYRASDLCYWRRELALARNAVLGESNVVQGCGL